MQLFLGCVFTVHGPQTIIRKHHLPPLPASFENKPVLHSGCKVLCCFHCILRCTPPRTARFALALVPQTRPCLMNGAPLSPLCYMLISFLLPACCFVVSFFFLLSLWCRADAVFLRAPAHIVALLASKGPRRGGVCEGGGEGFKKIKRHIKDIDRWESGESSVTAVWPPASCWIHS